MMAQGQRLKLLPCQRYFSFTRPYDNCKLHCQLDNDFFYFFSRNAVLVITVWIPDPDGEPVWRVDSPPLLYYWSSA